MAGPHIAGTFGATLASTGGPVSDSCVVSSGQASLRLQIVGLDASNRVKTQKRSTPGGAWVDQSTYSADQALTLAVSPGEEWRLAVVAQQPMRDIRYAMSV